MWTSNSEREREKWEKKSHRYRWDENEISMNYVDFFLTETCCDFFTTRLFHCVFFYLIQCWNLPFFDWRCFRSVHGQSVRRFPQFPIHFLAFSFSLVLPCFVFFSVFFMITLLHFPLWSFEHTYNTDISGMSLVAIHHWIPTVPIFFTLKMTQTLSRLWNSNEITLHTYAPMMCLKLKLSSKERKDSKFTIPFRVSTGESINIRKHINKVVCMCVCVHTAHI